MNEQLPATRAPCDECGEVRTLATCGRTGCEARICLSCFCDRHECERPPG